MAYQKKQKIFYRRGDDGEIVTIFTRVCWRCRVWFGTPHEDDPWECPVCRGRNQRREKKTWPMARKVEQR